MRAILLKESVEMQGYIYLISNASLQIFFGLKEMNAALKVAEQVVQYVPVDCPAPKADRVMYNFYIGRVHLHFHDFIQAEDSLSLAFDQCLPSKFNNRR